MLRKKLKKMVCLVSLSLFLTACGGQNAQSGNASSNSVHVDSEEESITSVENSVVDSVSTPSLSPTEAIDDTSSMTNDSGDNSVTDSSEDMNAKYNIVAAYGFKEGYAWIVFRPKEDEKITYTGFIDKEGKLQKYYKISNKCIFNNANPWFPVNIFYEDYNTQYYGCDAFITNGGSFYLTNYFENGIKYLISNDKVYLP